MAERKKVGILFGYSEGWIGGSYYFINLILALKQLTDEVKPHLVIVTNDDNSYNQISATGYPYISRLNGSFKYSVAERLINKIGKIFTGKSLINKGYNDNELPLLFGYYEQMLFFKCKRKLFWIPDLQDRHYPQYLGNDVAESRKKKHIVLAYSASEIIFSSNDSMQDFEHFYPDLNSKNYVMPFAVTLPLLSDIEPEKILKKFNLPEQYFIAPNQFWSHKNHLTVIKAIEFLKHKGINTCVVFTGNEDTGGGKYAVELKEYSYTKNLTSNTRFLGFIDRKEQLILMQESMAVIQPSLFEGWSTVIEDAKALNKFIIASDLKVHLEQLKGEAVFFKALDFEELAELIKQQMNGQRFSERNYKTNVLEYANRFMQIINKAA